MARLPKKRGITQDGEDKSLILRQNLGNPPEGKGDENSSAELSERMKIEYKKTRNSLQNPT